MLEFVIMQILGGRLSQSRGSRIDEFTGIETHSIGSWYRLMSDLNRELNALEGNAVVHLHLQVDMLSL